MDHAITLRQLSVMAANSEEVLGKTQLGNDERLWSFIPEKPWSTGTYRLQFANTLEDLAGNNVGKAFEVNVFKNIETRIQPGLHHPPLFIE